MHPRAPRALCQACVLEARDSAGRRLRFFNESLSGGFRAEYADGTPYPSHQCFVRNVPCWADESRFGGIIVELRG